MRANTVLFLGAIRSHSMLTEIDQPTHQHFALLPPPKLRAFAIPLCPMSCSPLTQNEPVTSLFPTDWNSTQRGESCPGLQPKGLVTQVTPVRQYPESFHLDFSLSTKNAYGPPHIPLSVVW